MGAPPTHVIMHIARANLFRATRGATRNASAAANRDGMAPLSTAEADAWEAFLRLRRSDRKLIDPPRTFTSIRTPELRRARMR